MLEKPYFKNTFIKIGIVVGSVLYTLAMIRLLYFNGRHVGEGYQYNLVPFHTIKQLILNKDHYDTGTWVRNLFGNIVLFIPIGFILPLWSKACLKLPRFLMASVLLLFVVELTQLLTRVGTMDIDDVILNLLGALAGFGMTKTAIKFFKGGICVRSDR
jgi:glycopeptide antibiotics resistance protein